MLLKLENLNHYQSNLLLAAFKGDKEKLLTEWAEDPDSLLAECSFITQGLLAKTPNSKRDSFHGFSQKLKVLQEEEDVRQLEWIEVSNDDILLAQGSVFDQVIIWYLQQYIQRKLVLPPKSQWCPNRKKWIVTDGTHRFVAAQALTSEEKRKSYLIHEQTTVLAKTKKPITITDVHHLDQLIVSQ